MSHWFYVVVWVNNAKAIADSRITTPVNADRLCTLLDGYMFQSYIANGFRLGFHIGADNHLTEKLRTARVRKTKTNNNDMCNIQIVDKLNCELGEGRVLGPFDDLHVGNLVVSPLYVIEKSTPGKYRLIHHLSSPRGNSVNDCIYPNMRTVQYCSLLDVAKYIQKQPLSSDLYMAKMDLKDAYRCVPVHKDDWHLLGMNYQDKYFMDTCLPMGLSSSCFIFNVISDSINWLASKHGQAKIFSYLDDFFIVGTSRSKTLACLETLLGLCQDIGFPVSEHKTEYPEKTMVFLGLGVDCKARAFYVPHEKRVQLIGLIDTFLGAKKKRVLDFQKLLGKLNFVSATLIPGKSLMGSMFQQLQGVLSSEGWKSRKVTKDIKSDLRVWRQFLVASSSKQFKFMLPGTPNFSLATDASGAVGFGGVCNGMWFQGRWDDQWWSTRSIALLELYPVYVALCLWADLFADSVVLVNSDNASVISMLTNFYSREKQINIMLKECAFIVMANNIVLRASHVAGTANQIADKLSRFLPGHQQSEKGKFDLPDELQPASVKSKLYS